jgi:hypothetical protein
VSVAHFETAAARQKTPEWCWAACAQMALRSGGADVSQETIVAAIKGRLTAETASSTDLTRALNASGLSKDGAMWTARAIACKGAPVPGTLVEQLRQNKPVIISYPTGPFASHSVVAHEAYYQPTPAGPIITGITIFDPYSGWHFRVAGQLVPFETLNTWYISVQRNRPAQEETRKYSESSHRHQKTENFLTRRASQQQK